MNTRDVIRRFLGFERVATHVAVVLSQRGSTARRAAQSDAAIAAKPSAIRLAVPTDGARVIDNLLLWWTEK